MINFLCLGFLAQAFGFSASAEKIEISSCSETVCYRLLSQSMLASQIAPLWSLENGRLEVWTRGNPLSPKASQNVRFLNGIWDQSGKLYTLRNEKSEIVFDPQSGKIKTENAL